MTDQEKLFDMYQYGNYDDLFRWGTDMIKENARLRKESKQLKNDIYLLQIGIMGDGEDLTDKDKKRLDKIFPN